MNGVSGKSGTKKIPKSCRTKKVLTRVMGNRVKGLFKGVVSVSVFVKREIWICM